MVSGGGGASSWGAGRGAKVLCRRWSLRGSLYRVAWLATVVIVLLLRWSPSRSLVSSQSSMLTKLGGLTTATGDGASSGSITGGGGVMFSLRRKLGRVGSVGGLAAVGAGLRRGGAARKVMSEALDLRDEELEAGGG